jgi:hypothetical protein
LLRRFLRVFLRKHPVGEADVRVLERPYSGKDAIASEVLDHHHHKSITMLGQILLFLATITVFHGKSALPAIWVG